MSNSKQLAKNTAAQTASFGLIILVSFFLTTYIVEKIGTEVYGFVGLANNITSYVVVFTVAINSLANRYITIEYVKKDYTSANRYFSSVTAANVAVVGIIFVPAVILLLNLEKVINIPPEFVTDVKILWAFVFLMFGCTLAFGRMEVATFAHNRIDLHAVRTMESNIVKVIILVALFGFFAPKVYFVGVSAFICSLYMILANAHYMKKLTPELKFSKKLIDTGALKEMLTVGIWNSANQMSQMLFNGLDLLIANLFIGAAGMGLMSISKTIPLHLVTFVGMIAGAFYPAMTISYAKENKEDFIKETNFATGVCGFICAVPVVGVMVFGGHFYKLWLPSLTSAEVITVQILSVMALLPQYFSMYLFPLYQVNTLTCKLKVPSVINIVLGVVNVVTVFLLLKFTDLGLYAIAGVSSLLLIIRIVLFVPMYAAHSLKKSFKTFYPPLLRGMIFNGLLILLFGLTSRFVTVGSILSFSLWAGISGVAGYLIGLPIMFKKEDFGKVRNVFKKGK